MYGKVKIEPTDDDLCYNVFVNDKEIEHCTGVNFSVMPDELPEVDIEIYSTPEFEGEARVAFQYSPEAIETAKKILYTCLDNDDDFSEELFDNLSAELSQDDAEKAYDVIVKTLGGGMNEC